MNGIEAVKATVKERRACSTPFGVFELRRAPASTALNPMTGEPVPTPARTRVHFEPSDRLLRDATGELGLARARAHTSSRAMVFRVHALDPSMHETVATAETFVTAREKFATAAPDATVGCEAFYADVLRGLANKRVAKYSGFGSFRLTRHRPPHLELAISPVWDQEVRDVMV